jgi:hypothetical protein
VRPAARITSPHRTRDLGNFAPVSARSGERWTLLRRDDVEPLEALGHPPRLSGQPVGVLVALGAIVPLRPPEADVAVTLDGDDELLPEGAVDDGADAAVGPPALAPVREVRVVAVDDVRLCR